MKIETSSRLGRVLLTVFILCAAAPVGASNDERDPNETCSIGLEAKDAPEQIRLTRLARLRLRWTLARQEFREVERASGTAQAYAYMVGVTVGMLTGPFRNFADDEPPPYVLPEPIAVAYFESLARVIDVIVSDATKAGITSPVSTRAVKMDSSLTLEPNGAIAIDIPARGPITLKTPLGNLVVYEEIDTASRDALLARLTDSFGLIESIPVTSDGNTLSKLYAATRLPDGTPLPEPAFVGWDRASLSYNEHMRLWNLVKPDARAGIEPPPPRREVVVGWKDLD